MPISDGIISTNIIELFIAMEGDRTSNDLKDSSKVNYAQKASDLPSDLQTKISNQTGVLSNFLGNFVNYNLGQILCVNTSTALNQLTNTSGLKFTVVSMPEEFINKVSSIKSGYFYGEALTVSIIIEKQENGITKYTYRDTNRRGRSISGGTIESVGSSIGVWS